MNIKFVIGQLGMLVVVLGLFLLLAAGWGAAEWWFFDAQRESDAAAALAMVGLASVLLGAIPRFVTRRVRATMGRREAFLIVALSWMLGAAIGAAPYYVWSQITDLDIQARESFASLINCYFETMSGMTTTGATILTHINDIPRCLLLWRATTHWLGGLGIIVLFVAVLPTLGAGGKKLFRVEAPGPQPEGVRPQMADTARLLWIIYLSLTVAEIIALRFAGMNWHESICHTFATLATGGFSTRNASIAAFGSVPIETIIIVFMVLAGVNFGLYYRILRGRVRQAACDPEVRLYLAILLVATLFVVGCLIEEYIVDTTGQASEPSIGAAIRHGVFQVVAIMTTTGFCTADFDQWGFFPKATLLGLMFIGASAGSTGGGIKVIRILIVFKVLILEIERVYRPNVVRPLKTGRVPIEPALRLTTVAYVLGILIIFLVGALLIMAFEGRNPEMLAHGTEIDFTTAASASAATLNNIGPGLALVGAVENYAWFTNPSKIIMILLMALGRLEVFAILILFVPRFWRTN